MSDPEGRTPQRPRPEVLGQDPVIIFAMVVAGVWLMQYAEAEPAARAVGRAPDPADKQEARESLSTSRSSILVVRAPEDLDARQLDSKHWLPGRERKRGKPLRFFPRGSALGGDLPDK